MILLNTEEDIENLYPIPKRHRSKKTTHQAVGVAALDQFCDREFWQRTLAEWAAMCIGGEARSLHYEPVDPEAPMIIAESLGTAEHESLVITVPMRASFRYEKRAYHIPLLDGRNVRYELTEDRSKFAYPMLVSDPGLDVPLGLYLILSVEYSEKKPFLRLERAPGVKELTRLVCDYLRWYHAPQDQRSPIFMEASGPASVSGWDSAAIDLLPSIVKQRLATRGLPPLTSLSHHAIHRAYEMANLSIPDEYVKSVAGRGFVATFFFFAPVETGPTLPEVDITVGLSSPFWAGATIKKLLPIELRCRKWWQVQVAKRSFVAPTTDGRTDNKGRPAPAYVPDLLKARLWPSCLNENGEIIQKAINVIVKREANRLRRVTGRGPLLEGVYRKITQYCGNHHIPLEGKRANGDSANSAQ